MYFELKRFIYVILCFLFSFFISFFIIKFILKRKSRGQVERDFALKSHKLKEGTPTMGGIAIVSSIFLSSIVFCFDLLFDLKAISLLFITIIYFFIGFFDDYLKIKRNSYEGLKGIYRLLLEIFTVFLLILYINTYINRFSYIEIKLLDLVIPTGVFLLFLIILIVVGVSNSVNLTDGLDGLASGMMLTSITPFILIALMNNEFNIALILISLVGSLSAFLIFNIHPAKIFMGDCGSLSLGALISFSGILLKEYLTLFIACSFFIFETISVIIQVIYYKKTKKRIFLMAPFHHHLEKKGVPEWKIVMSCWLFGIITSIVCIIIEVV